MAVCFVRSLPSVAAGSRYSFLLTHTRTALAVDAIYPITLRSHAFHDPWTVLIGLKGPGRRLRSHHCFVVAHRQHHGILSSHPWAPAIRSHPHVKNWALDEHGRNHGSSGYVHRAPYVRWGRTSESVGKTRGKRKKDDGVSECACAPEDRMRDSSELRLALFPSLAQVLSGWPGRCFTRGILHANGALPIIRPQEGV